MVRTQRKGRTKMRGAKWLVGALIVVAVTAMQLYGWSLAEATHLRTKYSDPTLQALLENPFTEGFGFFVVDVTNITADVKCCPKPDSDKGCKTTPDNHIQDAVQISFNFDTPECKNAQRCNFQDDIATLRDLADEFQTLVCPGSQVIRDITKIIDGVPETFPEMAFTHLTARVTAVDCGASDPTCTCGGPEGCPVIQCYLANWDYPFKLTTLPMDGTFKSSDDFETLALTDCYGGTWFGPPPTP